MDRPFRWRIPVAVWIGLAVITGHVLFFLAVWDKHFLPKVPPAPPTPAPVNFGAVQTDFVDNQTGETVTERDFTVSTRLVTPPPSPAAMGRR